MYGDAFPPTFVSKQQRFLAEHKHWSGGEKMYANHR
jgi:hypothetical protein